MAYDVHLEIFDGPFELLLRLISAQELDLYEVSLADIVDAFLAELDRIERLDLEVATEFLLIAATLVELKCRRLLPDGDDVELDEELSLYEARDYLLARLLECKTFSGAAGELAALEQAAQQRVARRAGPDERFEGCAPDLLAAVTPQQLGELAARAMADRPVPVVETAHVHVDEVSVAATLEELAGVLPELGATTFRALTERSVSRAHLVATFLALLELFKRSLVDLDQPASFGELRVRWTGGPSPGASLAGGEPADSTGVVGSAAGLGPAGLAEVDEYLGDEQVVPARPR